MKHGIQYDQNCLKQNALKREQKNLILVLINVGDQHSNNAIIAWIIQCQLCGRVMKMGCILMETSKMLELDNNIKNNGADPWQ